MLLLKLVLFVGMFVGITYGIEFVMPPFGQLYYTNPLDILLSLSQTFSYRVGVSKDLSLALTVLIIGLVPLICVIALGKNLKKKRKQCKYKF